jgi:two-component system phosphate regulon response regulator PhoB
MAKVLVVEDEVDVRDLLSLHLKREGYEVSAFEDSEKALVACTQQSFDLFILDWMLPGLSGLDLCKALRTKLNIKSPILMLTARADTMDKVLGLEIGADDYLTKPFEIREFVARVRALLRRNQNTSQDMIEAFGIKVNLSSKQVQMDGVELALTPFEFKLLSALMMKAGTVMERTSLVSLIQGSDVSVVERTIDTLILGLRKKLAGKSDLIETVRGFGYRFRK